MYHPDIMNCNQCTGPGSDCRTCQGVGFVPVGGAGGGDGAIEYVRRLVSLLVQHVNDLQEQIDQLQGTTGELHADAEGRQRLAATRTQEYYASQDEQNRDLRQEIRFLAETMGLKPARVNGDPWLPLKKRPEPLLTDGDASKPAEAIRVMVRHVLREELDDDVAISEDSVRKYVRAAIDDVLLKAVRKAIGVDESFGRVSIKNSVIKEKIDEIVKPALDEIVAEKVPTAIAALELDDLVSDWLRDELRDHFVTSIRRNIRDGVTERAKAMATVAVNDVADAVIMDEMPFLKKYLAVKRLGNDLSKMADDDD